MDYSGPIDIDALVDLDKLVEISGSHFTFFAFPIATLNEHGLPSDTEAQQYIAAVQATGVPIGIWLNSPVGGTGYAAVSNDNIAKLKLAIDGLTQYTISYAAELCERLFREAAVDGT